MNLVSAISSHMGYHLASFTTQRNNNTYDSATIPVIKSNNNEISSNESYTQHGGVTIAIDNAEKEVSNTSKALNKDCSPENSNVSKAGYLSENHYQENNSCEKLCVAELTPEGYGLHRRKDFVSNHESITALDIEKGTFFNSERVIIQTIDKMIVKGKPTIIVGHVNGMSVSDKVTMMNVKAF
ncbi:unnamed protein product [Mytilus coruscus]|uniref:Uncharacterized protein n=1 Tax=Mytilus coruscus TaxID=42192 RepID=A0A6J8DAI5_MYTCO|nr:unnamed protein product [Mytilus coruscus]